MIFSVQRRQLVDVIGLIVYLNAVSVSPESSISAPARKRKHLDESEYLVFSKQTICNKIDKNISAYKRTVQIKSRKENIHRLTRFPSSGRRSSNRRGVYAQGFIRCVYNE